jgi:hypothetical protein
MVVREMQKGLPHMGGTVHAYFIPKYYERSKIAIKYMSAARTCNLWIRKLMLTVTITLSELLEIVSISEEMEGKMLKSVNHIPFAFI